MAGFDRRVNMAVKARLGFGFSGKILCGQGKVG